MDGDGDGKVRRASPADSAATLARMIWASGDLRAGLFQHNHAAWYVDAVLEDAEAMAGKCQVHTVAYSVALPGPTDARSTGRTSSSRTRSRWCDIQRGVIDPRVIGLLAAISQEHTIRISALRSDHSKTTVERQRLEPLLRPRHGHRGDRRRLLHRRLAGRPLRHDRPRSSARCRPASEPTELIYCFDPDGPATRTASRRPTTATTSTSGSTA